MSTAANRRTGEFPVLRKVMGVVAVKGPEKWGDLNKFRLISLQNVGWKIFCSGASRVVGSCRYSG